jgi:hypothetical protein
MVQSASKSRQAELLRAMQDSLAYYTPEFTNGPRQKADPALSALDLMYAYYGTR